MGRTTPYYVPSYLDNSDGRGNFQRFADTMMHIGPVRFRPVKDSQYTLQHDDVDWCLRFDDYGTVYVPKDDDLAVPPGTQVAVLNNSEHRVVVKGIGEVVIAGCDRPVIDKWRVGVLVKYNANFWLLSLGSGAATGPATPSAPTLLTAKPGNKQVGLTWAIPTDDGGSPITAYQVEYSADEKDWKPGPKTDAATLAAAVTGLAPGQTFFRVRALNENGEGDPSNILSASPLLPAPEVRHTGAGVFTIQGYDPANTYTATATAGTASIDGNGNVSVSDPNAVVTLRAKFGTSESLPVYFQRKAYTYHPERHCDTNCRFAGWNCFHCDGDCVGCQ